ncbi:hypothetical protein SDC9_115977 [bioreactor metagenome]|uniref:Uncharacterized protein n=1 Tax=bioreactor metagenome TaxID=1076179 RepID=A0A645C120_9ZZZZ
MPVFAACALQRVENPSAQAGFGIERKAGNVLGNLIRSHKTDAVHVPNDLVRVLLDAAEAKFAVDFVELVSLADGDAVRFQRKQNIPHHPVFRVAGENHIPPFCADTGDLRKPRGRFVQNGERVHAEFGDDGLCRGRPDALDQPAAKVIFNRAQRGGRKCFVAVCFELAAILGVRRVVARELNAFANGSKRQRADDRELFALVGDKLQHRPAVFAVAVDNRIDDSADFRHVRSRASGIQAIARLCLLNL